MATVRSMPVLQVREVAASGRSCDRFGFVTHIWGEPPDVGIAQRGDVTMRSAARARADRWR